MFIVCILSVMKMMCKGLGCIYQYAQKKRHEDIHGVL